MLVLLRLAVASARAAEPPIPPALEEARRLAGMGGIDLALERIEQAQPRQPDAATWLEWEALRLELWASRSRDAEILARALAYPDPLPPGRAAVGLLTSAVRRR